MLCFVAVFFGVERSFHKTASMHSAADSHPPQVEVHLYRERSSNTFTDSCTDSNRTLASTPPANQIVIGKGPQVQPVTQPTEKELVEMETRILALIEVWCRMPYFAKCCVYILIAVVMVSTSVNAT